MSSIAWNEWSCSRGATWLSCGSVRQGSRTTDLRARTSRLFREGPPHADRARCVRPAVLPRCRGRAPTDAHAQTCLHPGVSVTPDVATRLAELADRYGLRATVADRLGLLLDLVAEEPSSITAVRDPAQSVDVHVADSLVALELPEVRNARRIADLGSGGGFPGLALAIALPDARVALVESVGRKVAFVRGAIEGLGIANAEAIQARAEDWPEGLGAHDLVTARALAPLPVLVEYAAPLLAIGGSLVAWKAARDDAEEADGDAGAAALGMGELHARPVAPFRAARDRHLYLSSKVSPTPPGYPRRVGIARKRPFRASG
jgi:16S rRNA (guanine527-N7)-methyltransferase